MSVNDPIADMLTRVRNALSAGHSVVSMPSTKLKIEVSRILKEEGYIDSFEVVEDEQSVSKVLRIMALIAETNTATSMSHRT